MLTESRKDGRAENSIPRPQKTPPPPTSVLRGVIIKTEILQTCQISSNIQYYSLLYDWRESCPLISPIYLDKFLCQPENRIKLVYRLILVSEG